MCGVKQMKKTFNVCLLIAMIGILLVSEGMSLTPEELVESLSAREQSITSLKGKFRLNSQLLLKGKFENIEMMYEWTRKDKMQKLTIEYLSFPESFKKCCPKAQCGQFRTIIETGRIVKTFDGEITTTYFVEKKQAMIHRGNYIFETPADWLLLRFAQKPLSTFLKQQDMDIVYIGQVELQNEICHLLEFSDNNKRKGRIYLSENKGFTPVKFEIEIGELSDTPITKVIYILSKFRDFENIWLPQEVTCHAYDVYADREEVIMKEIMTVNKLQVNIEISPEDFIIKLPPRTHVHDSILGIDYKVQ